MKLKHLGCLEERGSVLYRASSSPFVEKLGLCNVMMCWTVRHLCKTGMFSFACDKCWYLSTLRLYAWFIDE